MTTQKDTTYFKFKEIPYAEPPIGDLRLRDPVPKQPWKGVLDAKQEIKRSCLQPDVNGGTFGLEVRIVFFLVSRLTTRHDLDPSFVFYGL